MKHTISNTIVVLFLLLGIQSADAKDLKVTWSKSDNKVIAHVDWCLNHRKHEAAICASKWDESQLERPRITEGDSVQIFVEGFNFVNYQLEVSVEETKIESYVYLNDIWSQLLGGVSPDLLADFLAARGKAQDSETALIDWWRKIDTTAETLTGDGLKFSSQSYLSYADIAVMLESISGENGLDNSLIELQRLRDNARNSLSRTRSIKTFESIDQLHQQLVAQIATYKVLVNKSKSGYTTSIKKKAPGTFVDVGLKAVQINGGILSDQISFSYLSESKLPLMFHAGFTYSQLKESEFQSLRSLSGQDIFARVKEEDESYSLGVFLSHPFGKSDKGKYRYYITLGTDIDDIGEKIYLGLSSRVYDKWLFSIGAAFGDQSVGEQAVEDLPNNNLFELIREERDTQLFMSVSYQLF